MMKIFHIVFCLLLALSILNLSAEAAEGTYNVDGFSLGAVVPTGTYQAYKCAPSEQYSGFMWCKRVAAEQEPRGKFESSHSLLLSAGGRVWYVNKYVEPAFWRPGEVVSDIKRLSRLIGREPEIIRMPHVAGFPDGVMAIWGSIVLEPLDRAALSVLAAGQSPNRGILVDYIGKDSFSLL